MITFSNEDNFSDSGGQIGTKNDTTHQVIIPNIVGHFNSVKSKNETIHQYNKKCKIIKSGEKRLVEIINGEQIGLLVTDDNIIDQETYDKVTSIITKNTPTFQYQVNKPKLVIRSRHFNRDLSSLEGITIDKISVKYDYHSEWSQEVTPLGFKLKVKKLNVIKLSETPFNINNIDLDYLDQFESKSIEDILLLIDHVSYIKINIPWENVSEFLEVYQHIKSLKVLSINRKDFNELRSKFPNLEYLSLQYQMWYNNLEDIKGLKRLKIGELKHQLTLNYKLDRLDIGKLVHWRPFPHTPEENMKKPMVIAETGCVPYLTKLEDVTIRLVNSSKSARK